MEKEPVSLEFRIDSAAEKRSLTRNGLLGGGIIAAGSIFFSPFVSALGAMALGITFKCLSVCVF